MKKVSIRQPLVAYALVFMVAVAFVVLTLASFAMVNASRRAYRRATTQELRALSRELSLAEVRRLVASFPASDELALAVVTSSVSALGLDAAAARQVSLQAEERSAFIAVPIAQPGVEAFLVAQVSTTIPVSIAFVEITRLMPLVLLAALAFAAILTFLIARLLLPPLDALAEVAADPRPADPAASLTTPDAPTEIHDVARRFRQTIRLLNEERDLVQAQKDELGRMQESLVRASKLASVGRLAAGIAHEVGNPLAAVKGYLSLLKLGLEEPERTEVLDRSAKELDRIHGTIKKLLTYARQGETSAEPARPLSTRAVVREALALVRGHPALSGTEVVDALGPDEGPDAVGHAGRLNQVVVNLLLNAAQAMEGRPGSKVTLRREAEGERVALWVEDNGPGIPEALRDAIFDPFFTTKEPGEGTGLGLAVSRALMEAMGGDLRLAAHEGEGASFVAHLPTASSATPD
jgi:two-component system NtrC family sensor kinase